MNKDVRARTSQFRLTPASAFSSVARSVHVLRKQNSRSSVVNVSLINDGNYRSLAAGYFAPTGIKKRGAFRGREFAREFVCPFSNGTRKRSAARSAACSLGGRKKKKKNLTIAIMNSTGAEIVNRTLTPTCQGMGEGQVSVTPEVIYWVGEGLPFIRLVVSVIVARYL